MIFEDMTGDYILIEEKNKIAKLSSAACVMSINLGPYSEAAWDLRGHSTVTSVEDSLAAQHHSCNQTPT